MYVGLDINKMKFLPVERQIFFSNINIVNLNFYRRNYEIRNIEEKNVFFKEVQ